MNRILALLAFLLANVAAAQPVAVPSTLTLDSATFAAIRGPQGEPGPPGPPGASGSGGKPTVLYGASTQWGALPVSVDQDWWYTIYRVCVPAIAAGDVLSAYAETQVRNDLGFNVELAQVLTVQDHSGTSPCVGGPPPSTQTALIGPVGGTNENEFPRGPQPINGWNITPGEHYGRASKAFTWVAPAARPNGVWVQFRLRARSSAANNSGNLALTVQANQGHLVVLRW